MTIFGMGAADYATTVDVVVDIRERRASIELNRPEKLNALNLSLVGALAEAAERVAGEPDVDVVVVRGRGRSFCAGLDLDMFSAEGMPPDFYRRQERALRLFETMDKIVVAAIHGHCIGGGVQIAAACDVRVAAADAVFAIPAVEEGVFPGMAPYRLPRLIGKGRAASLILTARRLDAREAERIGLVDHVGDFDPVIDAYARAPREAAAASKRLIARSYEASFETAMAESEALLEECLRTPGAARAREIWAARRR
jgi:enoyl-CoA hydratase/3-hydroxyacyl-CoA dehydrogenase